MGGGREKKANYVDYVGGLKAFIWKLCGVVVFGSILSWEFDEDKVWLIKFKNKDFERCGLNIKDLNITDRDKL